MATRIRLRRVGRKGQGSYRIVVAEHTTPRDGRFIATLGNYNPRPKEAVITVDDRGKRQFQVTGRSASHPLYDRLRAASTAGLVLFSSGTSGRSKASVLDFSKVLGRYGAPTRPRRTLSFLSLDHIGGINTLLHTLLELSR